MYTYIYTKFSDNDLCHCTSLLIYYCQKAGFHYARRFKIKRRKETSLQTCFEEIVVTQSIWTKK